MLIYKYETKLKLISSTLNWLEVSSERSFNMPVINVVIILELNDKICVQKVRMHRTQIFEPTSQFIP